MIKIQLDRPAVRSLIDEDSDLKFELSNAVVSEVIRKVFEKDMARLMKEAEPALFKKALAVLQTDVDMAERLKRALTQQLTVYGSYSQLPAMSPTLKKIFDEAVIDAEAKLASEVSRILDSYVTEKAKTLVDAKLIELDIDTRVAKRVDRLVNEELEKQVLAHHDRLLRKMKEALG